MAKIALGVTSSVSLYKACEILRGFQKAGHEVQVIETRNATALVAPALFDALSGRRTIIELFDDRQPWSVAHVALAKEIGLFVVAPATANILAKFAAGLADDFLSTFYLAVRSPILIAPAMNEAMWYHPQVQENIRRLRERGVQFVDPAGGFLACGDEGLGRLADPNLIVARGLDLLSHGDSLRGKTVLVTAGPTHEALDPVRYLSNRSSGRMGFEIAREARRRGADVVLVAGPTAIDPPAGIEVVRVVTAAEMKKAVDARFPSADITVMAAAVADFTFPSAAARKIKKSGLKASLEVVPTADILKGLGGRKKDGRILVGFAAETHDLEESARAKVRDKNLDLVVANDVSRDGVGFDADLNQAVLIDRRGRVRSTDILSKRALAAVVWDAIEDLREQKK
ncbi:MAG: bifunctional phosphopantothenoylcysteine decarboxylase/phosphopantothenate--cysteine ligase CoaBC [Candidatus Aminicenantes bacterium]|nr:bifunctional phosphopantothenoylcysteine decarboxylase/phosphopantothenate--cysteine ligase CoaBC [Candidatus Aminicenantes bacterium]